MLRRLLGWGIGVGFVLVAGCAKKESAATNTATPAVTDIDLGRTINADKTIADGTESFKPSDTIYASVETDAAAPVTVAVRWSFENGQVVNESSQAVNASGKARTEFHISKPDGWPTGKYKVEVMLDGKAAGSKSFTVQ